MQRLSSKFPPVQFVACPVFYDVGVGNKIGVVWEATLPIMRVVILCPGERLNFLRLSRWTFSCPVAGRDHR